MVEVGQVVRHRTQASWGNGQVVSVRSDGKVEVRFAGRQGHVLLSLAAATQLLEVVAGEPPPAFGRQGASRAERCSACRRPLRTSVFALERTLKSCPECSGRNGREHVYHPYPDAFGLSEARAEGGAEDGAQSWCQDCRGGARGGAGRYCSSI